MKFIYNRFSAKVEKKRTGLQDFAGLQDQVINGIRMQWRKGEHVLKTLIIL